ncbi:Fe-S-containing hydro-lyase [uncultured Clostridium sp.]|uniref:Fe-S-containing hydro-lyase n=1 Tax=uncultured Clostridium sp. TaxID=59620 RepID=UPI00262F6ECB|nr:Fe-S-containing hydro-lyase [uncultured Clostridium sp.]
MREIMLPLKEEDIRELKIGESVLLSGIMYTGRDAAHKRIVESIDKKEELPFDIKGQTIYYVGPTPNKEGEVIGSAGPTTSYRMDSYTPILLDLGLKGMIGKGSRSKDIIEAMVRNKCIYFAAIGGAGALISKSIISSKIIAYEDLGAEAVRRIEVKKFPVIVAIDSTGEDLYKVGREKYLVSK